MATQACPCRMGALGRPRVTQGPLNARRVKFPTQTLRAVNTRTEGGQSGRTQQPLHTSRPRRELRAPRPPSPPRSPSTPRTRGLPVTRRVREEAREPVRCLPPPRRPRSLGLPSSPRLAPAPSNLLNHIKRRPAMPARQRRPMPQMPTRDQLRREFDAAKLEAIENLHWSTCVGRVVTAPRSGGFRTGWPWQLRPAKPGLGFYGGSGTTKEVPIENNKILI
jgi:hypothetical protein